VADPAFSRGDARQSITLFDYVPLLKEVMSISVQQSRNIVRVKPFEVTLQVRQTKIP
jgi:hypothetical protein